MSGLFQRVLAELGIKQLKSSAYHPESQDALERYHHTMKTMLRAYCLVNLNPGDWDKGIPFVLFATCDAPHESTSFRLFELVYGQEVRGLLKFLKERLLNDTGKDDPNLLDYVSSFRERLSGACEVAREHLNVSQQVMKTRFDQKAETRNFKPGDKVLALLPVTVSKEPLAAKLYMWVMLREGVIIFWPRLANLRGKSVNLVSHSHPTYPNSRGTLAAES